MKRIFKPATSVTWPQRLLASIAAVAFIQCLNSSCRVLYAEGESMRFYCGTYTTSLGHVDGRATAVGIYDLDDKNGQMRLVGHSPPIANSSHLCLGREEEFLYAVSEIVSYQGREDGSLSVFAVDSEAASLTLVQTVSSAGPGPAFVHLDQTGRFLLLANYVAGNVVVYPIENNGSLVQPTAHVMHRGSSVNKSRQEAPHPHSIVPSPDNRAVFVPDLGIDRIVAYQFDAISGKLTATPEADVVTPPGSGPRHLAFASDGKFAFCSLELTSEVAAYAYADGRLTELSRHSTLPSDHSGGNTCAEVRVSPDGRHVYVSNRGHDSIAALAVDAAQGTLRFVDTTASGGRTPRNFGISTDGRWLVVGNQDSHNLVSFRRDTASGRLTRAAAIDCPSAALIRFVGGP